jgi:outer membrane receptor protein involved in Fe transport
VEVELAGVLTDNWTYMLGYNYTNSEWDVDGFVGSSPLFEGDQLPGVPKHMASLSTDYYWPIDLGEVYFHMDAFYRSSAETAPNPSWGNYEDLDSFSIWNFSVGLEQPKWGLRVFLDNAFNEVGVTGGQLEAGYLNYAYHFVQRPRTFGAQVRYKFK